MTSGSRDGSVLQGSNASLSTRSTASLLGKVSGKRINEKSIWVLSPADARRDMLTGSLYQPAKKLTRKACVSDDISPTDQYRRGAKCNAKEKGLERYQRSRRHGQSDHQLPSHQRLRDTEPTASYVRLPAPSLMALNNSYNYSIQIRDCLYT